MDRSWLRGDDQSVREHLEKELERVRAATPERCLGLSRGATADDVRAQFLVATKTFHPTRFARRPDDVRRMANDLFLLVKEAYETLSGAEKPARASASQEVAKGKTQGQAAVSKVAAGERAKPAAPERPAPSKSRPSRPSSGAPAITDQRPPDEVLRLPRFREAARFCDEGKYGDAQSILAELAKERPANIYIESHLHFAKSGLYLERGRTKLAISELKKALAADPNFGAAKKALLRLAKGRIGAGTRALVRGDK